MRFIRQYASYYAGKLFDKAANTGIVGALVRRNNAYREEHRRAKALQKKFNKRVSTSVSKDVKISELERALQLRDENYAELQGIADSRAEKIALLEEEVSSYRANVSALTADSDAYLKHAVQDIVEFLRLNRDAGYFMLDRKGSIIRSGGRAIKNMGYAPMELRGLSYSALLCKEDAERFAKAVRDAVADPEVAGFELGAGLRRADDKLVHYKVRARLSRDTQTFGEVRFVGVKMKKARYDFQMHVSAQEIRIPRRINKERLKRVIAQLNEAGKRASEGERVTVNLQGVRRLRQSLLSKIGDLLVKSENVSAVGVKDLNPTFYTAFRHPSLGVPAERLGIQKVTFHRGKIGSYRERVSEETETGII